MRACRYALPHEVVVAQLRAYSPAEPRLRHPVRVACELPEGQVWLALAHGLQDHVRLHVGVRRCAGRGRRRHPRARARRRVRGRQSHGCGCVSSRVSQPRTESGAGGRGQPAETPCRRTPVPHSPAVDVRPSLRSRAAGQGTQGPDTGSDHVRQLRWVVGTAAKVAVAVCFAILCSKQVQQTCAGKSTRRLGGMPLV